MVTEAKERGIGMLFQSTRAARRALLTTVSAAALVFAVNNQAEAQTASPTWWASIEGQYNWIDGDALSAIENTAAGPLGFALEPKHGLAGKLHFGGMLDHDWSASVGIRYGRASKESDSAFAYSEFQAGGDADYEESHFVVDLEIGRDVGLGSSATARVFGGLRFAKFDGDGTGGIYSSFNTAYADFSTSQNFSGVGPRLGIDAAVPLAQNLRVDIGLAGALLYGKRKATVEGSYSGFYGSSSFSEKSNKKVWVPNVEASVALTYLLGSNVSISAGYKAEQFWNVMPTVSESGISNDDRLIHGPFMRLTITGN
jgi:hypothetical protein